jgi:TolA-binding protein
VVRRWLSLALAVMVIVVLPWVPAAVALEEPDRLWLVGRGAFQDKLYPLAVRTLERFIARYPDDPRHSEAVLLLGKSRLATGALQPALEAFRRAQTLKPPAGRPYEARFWEGETLFRLKRYTEARTVFDALLRDGPTSPLAPDATYGLAWAALELKEPETAVSLFRELLAKFPDHALAPPASFYLARALVDLKQFDEAQALLQTFLQKHPTHQFVANAQYLLGVARIGRGEVTEGVADLRSFVAAYPRHELESSARRLIFEALANRPGELAAEYGALMAATPTSPERLADAIIIARKLGSQSHESGAWDRLRREFPDHPVTRRTALEQATSAFQRNDYGEAVTLAEMAALSDDVTVRTSALLLIGEAELKLRRLAPALKAFGAVLNSPSSPVPLRARALAGSALVAEGQQQWAEALKLYEQVIADSPDEALRQWAREAVLALGRTRLAAGDFGSALAAFRRAQSFTPPVGRSQEAKFWEAEALFRSKQYAEARAAYDAVLDADAASPLAPDAMYGRTVSDLEMKRPEAAAASARQLLDTWPNHALAPAAAVHLARARIDLKQEDQALAVLDTFLQNHPTHELAPEVRYLRGSVRLATGKTSEGIADLRSFLSAHPDHPQAEAARRKVVDAALALGRSGGEPGRNRTLLTAAYQILMATAPPTPASLYEAGQIAGQLGNVRDRDAAWSRLRTQFPKDPLAQRVALNLADGAFRRNEYKETVALASTATQSGDGAVRAQALLLVGEAELKQKNFSAAIRALEAAATVRGVEPSVRFRALAGRGLAHEEQRQWSEALRLYEEVAQGSPDDTLKRWARDRAAAVKAHNQNKPAPKKGASKS